MVRSQYSVVSMSRVAVFLFASSLGLAQPTPDRPAAIKQYCTGCHNSKLKSGGLALDAIAAESPAQHPETWEKVVRRLRARQMPPAGLPRPDERTYAALVTSLESSLDAVKLDPGRTDTFRRLNRTEYRNAIRDLLAIDLDVSSMLPTDEASHGFDNVTVGDLSPTLLERYLMAARKISRLAAGSPLKSPGGDTITLRPDLTQEEHFAGMPFGTRGGTQMKHTFPLDAVYEIQVRLARDRNEHVEGLTGTHDVDLLLDGERVKLFTVTAPAPGVDHSKADIALNIRIPVKAGPHVVAVTFPKMPSTLLETERQPYPAHFNMDRHPRITPAVYSVTVNGPYEAKGPGDTPCRRRLYVCKSNDDACAKRILGTLMRRAYRRPVVEGDFVAPLQFFKQGRTEGGFDNGIEMALSAVLVSPEFLFRVEHDPAGLAPGTPYKVSNLQLASRLSFFLWSSIPDDELLEAATSGRLSNPAVLEHQVRRMLSDPRSRELVTNFASQWLHLRNLESVTPDMRAFPEFDDNLRQAFRDETELFLESVMREDRNVLELLSANYSFLNERLAKHYDIPGIYGSRLRRVDFGANSQRGGLLRHGSILTVTSYATRTSPVIRGKWVLDNILGIPPPPPPAAVPALSENTGISKTLSMRERLAKHRSNPACFGCHQLMDPVGFSLENYDAVGRWRTSDDGMAVDSDGGLPDGSKFDGVAGLQKALLNRPELFAGTLTEKLMTYALGRGVEQHDAPAVRGIVRQAKSHDYRFSSFIIGIAGSAPFQMRRSR